MCNSQFARFGGNIATQWYVQEQGQSHQYMCKDAAYSWLQLCIMEGQQGEKKLNNKKINIKYLIKLTLSSKMKALQPKAIKMQMKKPSQPRQKCLLVRT